MAERVGFEPTAHCCVTGFQDQLLKPLGHLSEYRLQKPCIILAYCFPFVNRFSPEFENEADKSSCYRLTEVLYLTTVKNKTEGVFV